MRVTSSRVSPPPSSPQPQSAPTASWSWVGITRTVWRARWSRCSVANAASRSSSTNSPGMLGFWRRRATCSKCQAASPASRTGPEDVRARTPMLPGGVPAEVDDDHGTVVEQVVARGERGHGRAVEFVVEDRSAVGQSRPHPADRWSRAGHHPFAFGPWKPHRQAGQVQQAAHVIPVSVRRQGEVGGAVQRPQLETVGGADRRPRRGDQRAQDRRQFGQDAVVGVAAEAGIDQERGLGVLDHEGRHRRRRATQGTSSLDEAGERHPSCDLGQRAHPDRHLAVGEPGVLNRVDESQVWWAWSDCTAHGECACAQHLGRHRARLAKGGHRVFLPRRPGVRACSGEADAACPASERLTPSFGRAFHTRRHTVGNGLGICFGSHRTLGRRRVAVHHRSR